MHIITISNQKGGSAKTSVTVNLAAALVENNKKVLVIDLDPQGSCSSWLKCQNDGKGLFNVFTENTSIYDIVVKSRIDGLCVIPASPWLIGADKTLATEAGAELILKNHLIRLPKEWDFCLIDTPPALGLLSLNALSAAHEVLIPVETRIMALQGLMQLTKTIQTVRDRLNPTLDILGVLPCRVDKRTRLSLDVIKELKKRLGEKLLPIYIRESVKIAECPSFAEPITIYDPKGAGAEDFRSLAKLIIERKK
ncbi:MAG: chromosome partitioning protein ParA [Chlamydia sp. 32-24]|nr:MAG: chromosome partitioning protein ParA [Chlamydia sp. 32-24]